MTGAAPFSRVPEPETLRFAPIGVNCRQREGGRCSRGGASYGRTKHLSLNFPLLEPIIHLGFTGYFTIGPYIDYTRRTTSSNQGLGTSAAHRSQG